ncbi:MAG: histidine--tRNA ligase [Oscillospiraceae bacterium]|nr:histidine--tRNA ligase [Oscillospiraceae bacterium]
MAKVSPRTLSGFMELVPREQMKMERIKEKLRSTYSSYGFTPLDTPVIEAAEVLLAKGGGDTEKQIYRFTKGDSDLALRFDLTVPLAKYVAAHYSELSFPFRRYQIGKVYRGERAQRGRFREFYQADIDIIGDGKLDIINEAEIPAIIYDTFSALGLKKFKIRVNNRKLLNGFYAINGMSERAGDIMRTVDKLDKIGAEKVKQLLIDEVKMLPCKADNVLDFMAIKGTNAQVIESLERYRGMDATFDLGLDELIAVTRYLADFGVPEENFAIDLTIARGLDYYTGTVYETEMTEHPEIGSVCSGGRYDNLAEYYTDKQLPGVGISIGLTRLFYVLGEQGLLSDELVSAPCDALVLPMTEDLGYAVSAAAALRNEGIRVQLYSEMKKFKAKMNYADKIGVPYVIFVGEDEIAENLLSVKDMQTGEQKKLGTSDAAALIKAAVAARNERPLIIDYTEI